MMKKASWLACALTLGNLLCGFAAILLAVKGYRQPTFLHAVPTEVAQAAWFIFVGMVMDGLDGRVARMTRADSAFGAELDSLADVVTFGLAPAVLAWVVGTHAGQPESLLWTAGALYAAATAIRLARYNVRHASPRRVKGPDFQGLPSPAAAGLVSGLLLLLESPAVERAAFVLPGVLAVAGVLMVSNIPYLHLMNRIGKRRGPALVALGLGLAASLALYPALTLSIAFLGYALSGLGQGLLASLLPQPEPEEDEWADEPLSRR